MTPNFRFEPATPNGRGLIARPRLIAALNDRFEHRITLITAPAGSGKTTALSQAFHNNLLDPVGRDIWLGAVKADADPLALLGGLAAACGLQNSGDETDDIALISDFVWTEAPDRVAFLIDDSHRLGDSCGMLLDALIAALPANASLVLSGRSHPPLRIARLQAMNEVVTIDEDVLRLDDEEANALVKSHGQGDATKLSRHAASAHLGLRVGPSAATEFLREEVLSHLKPQRLSALAAAGVIGDIDDSLALALSDGAYTVEQLTDGLPLIERHEGQGSCRIHELLRDALSTALNADQQHRAIEVAAEVELERGNLPKACEHLVQIGANSRVGEVARQFIVLPTLRAPVDAVRSVLQSVGQAMPGSGLHRLLEAQTALNLAAGEVIDRFGEAAQVACAEGDELVEAVAVFRVIQTANTRSGPFPLPYVQRIGELAETSAYASAVAAYVESLQLGFAGDTTGAFEAMTRCKSLGPDILMVMDAERGCDLGHPEIVAAGLTPDDLDKLPPGAEIFISFAMWLRGEAPPELALPIGIDMLPSTLRRGHTQTSASMLSVLAHIALAAGENDRAEDYAQRCDALARGQGDPRTELFATMALAAVASAAGDDSAAAALLDEGRTGIPLGAWPARPYLLGIPLLYLVSPHTRPTLDGCQFGPALRTAVRAGQALVALREDGDPTLAGAIPWHSPALRSHVLPHHLAELATAAAATGTTAATELLREIPNARPAVVAASASADSRVSLWATRHLESLPPEPRHAIQVRALGPLELLRDGAEVTDADWLRRARVRDLLALVVERGVVSRAEATSLLWPDLSSDKAANNMRVTLNRLHRVLEPSRAKKDEPVIIRSDHNTLQLGDGISLDVTVFEQTLEEARGLDRSGAPAEAIALYNSALAHWRGRYLEDIDGTWLLPTQARLDSLARAAVARVGELELARGEPEVAMRWAAAGQAANSLDERCGRLMMLAMLATGDRAGALRTADDLCEALAEAGLGPSQDTVKVLHRVRQ